MLPQGLFSHYFGYRPEGEEEIRVDQIIYISYNDSKTKRLDREDNPYPALIKKLKERYGLNANAYLLEGALAVSPPAIPVIGLEGSLSSINQGLDFLIEQLGWPDRVMKPAGLIQTQRFTSKKAYELFKEKCAKNQRRFKRNLGDNFALVA